MLTLIYYFYTYLLAFQQNTKMELTTSQEIGIDVNRSYSENCFLHAHNAFASSAYGWNYKQQSLSLEEMFDIGVRSFDFDIHWHKYSTKCKGDKAGKHIVLMHSDNTFLNVAVQRIGSPMLLKELLDVVRKLLKRNPQEIITIHFESYIGDTGPYTLWDVIDNCKLRKYVHVQRNNSRKWPKLSTLIESDKRLVLFSSSRGDKVNYAPYHISRTHWDSKVNPDGDVLYQTSGELFKFPHFKRFSSKIVNNYEEFNSKKEITRRYNNARDAFSTISQFNRIPNFLSLDFVQIGDGFIMTKEFNDLFSKKEKYRKSLD